MVGVILNGKKHGGPFVISWFSSTHLFSSVPMCVSSCLWRWKGQTAALFILSESGERRGLWHSLCVLLREETAVEVFVCWCVGVAEKGDTARLHASNDGVAYAVPPPQRVLHVLLLLPGTHLLSGFLTHPSTRGHCTNPTCVVHFDFSLLVHCHVVVC